MLKGETDIAVHSLKDVPVVFPEGLKLAAICSREDTRDAMISEKFAKFATYRMAQGLVQRAYAVRCSCLS